MCIHPSMLTAPGHLQVYLPPEVLLGTNPTGDAAAAGAAAMVRTAFGGSTLPSCSTVPCMSLEAVPACRQARSSTNCCRLCVQAGDCYAFGVVLWELVTGERPIRAKMRCVKCTCTGVRQWRASGLSRGLLPVLGIMENL